MTVIDSSASVAFNGDVPKYIWPIGNDAGEGVFDNEIRYRARLGLALVASSTAATFTAATDVSIGAWYR